MTRRFTFAALALLGFSGAAEAQLGPASPTAPVGGATAANQTATQNAPGTSGTKADAVQGVTGGVPVGVADPNNAAYGAQNIPITVGGASVTPLRAFDALCTVAGVVTVTLSGGGTKQFPVQGGTSAAPSSPPQYTLYPWGVSAITASTATCSAYSSVQ